MVFDPIEAETIDATERAIQRLLTQFRDSPVLIDILVAISTEVQELLDAIKGTIELRGPGSATGVQQDALGRIVGQSRHLGTRYNDQWFTPDLSLLGADFGKAWVPGVEFQSNPAADDVAYPFLIEGKVARNFTKYGSVPEIQEAIKISFDIDISFVTVGPMEVVGLVQDDTPFDILELLRAVTNTTRADSIYFMPTPQTVRIVDVFILSDYTP